MKKILITILASISLLFTASACSSASDNYSKYYGTYTCVEEETHYYVELLPNKKYILYRIKQSDDSKFTKYSGDYYIKGKKITYFYVTGYQSVYSSFTEGTIDNKSVTFDTTVYTKVTK